MCLIRRCRASAESVSALTVANLGGVKDIGRIKIFNGAIVEVLDPKKKVVYTAKIKHTKNGTVHEFVAKRRGHEKDEVQHEKDKVTYHPNGTGPGNTDCRQPWC